MNNEILRRLCYPMVPDNAMMNESRCEFTRGDVYLHHSVVLDYSVKILRRCRGRVHGW